MVSDVVRDVATARLFASDLGPGATGWERSTAAHCARDMGLAARVRVRLYLVSFLRA